MHSDTDEKIYAQLRSEFAAEARDGIEAVEDTLNNIASSPESNDEALKIIRRQVHSIKGLAEPFGYPFLANVAHQLEDHLLHRVDLDSITIRDIQQYCDVLSECLLWVKTPSNEELKEILGSLPGDSLMEAALFAPDDLFRSHVIVSSKTAYQMISSVMIPMGFQIKHSRNAINGFEYAVLNKPGLIIVSDVLDDLSGVDIVNAFAAMPATKDIPVIFMTSFDREHSDILNLPPNIPIIYLGSDIKGEILRALTSIEIRFVLSHKNCA
ncbi:MAG: Hpt domain-containing protein [Rhodospirillaceae bacterium]|nr:Hpt domain-containing protein [Rhodospirillaceae bacterium]